MPYDSGSGMRDSSTKKKNESYYNRTTNRNTSDYQYTAPRSGTIGGNDNPSPPPHVNPSPANQISKANAANPYNPPPVNNTAQQQAILAAQREAERQALLEAQRRAQEEAARQAAIAAQVQRDRLSSLVNQQKSSYQNRKLEQINSTGTYYWNNPTVPNRYVNPVTNRRGEEEEEPSIKPPNANLISQANAANPYNPPTVMPNLGFSLTQGLPLPKAQRNDEETYRQLQAQRQQYDNAAQVNAYLGYGYRGYPEAYSYRTAQLPTQGLATTGTAVNMTPGLANVENINIPASTTVPNTASAAPAASTAAPLSSATAYPELYRYRTTNLNTAGYTSTAPAAGTIEKSTGTANEAAIPKGSLRLRTSYGQTKQVIKAPYRVGGYTEAELVAMGNETRKDLIGPGGTALFEGYYKAPDGRYYPVDQGKANYALSRGMTNPYQYWYYYGYTPDKEAYRNVFGTYYGYTPSWRTTAYSNASGAGPVPAPKYAPSVPAPSGSTGAYGAGFSGVDITGQQRYFNPVVNWSY